MKKEKAKQEPEMENNDEMEENKADLHEKDEDGKLKQPPFTKIRLSASLRLLLSSFCPGPFSPFPFLPFPHSLLFNFLFPMQILFPLLPSHFLFNFNFSFLPLLQLSLDSLDFPHSLHVQITTTEKEMLHLLTKPPSATAQDLHLAIWAAKRCV